MKTRSVLYKLAMQQARPVNGLADTVAGFTKRQRLVEDRKRLQKQIKQTKHKLEKLAPGPELDSLRSKLDMLGERLKGLVQRATSPHTNDEAVQRAKTALERAHWQAKNKRG